MRWTLIPVSVGYNMAFGVREDLLAVGPFDHKVKERLIGTVVTRKRRENL